MKKQLLAAKVLFLLLSTVFEFSASALEITGVFQFESTPSNSKAGDKLADSFSIFALELSNELRTPPETTFSRLNIENNSKSATIIGIFVYDPNHVAPLFRQTDGASLSETPSFPVPQDILDLFTPTTSRFATTASSVFGVPPGGYFGFVDEDVPIPGLVAALENGSVRVAILVTGFKGDQTATFVNTVPDAGSTAILLLASLFSVELARRKLRV